MMDKDVEQHTATLENVFQKLHTRFDPMLALAMHIRGTAAGQALSWEEIVTKMHGLADAEQALPLPPGMAEQDLTDCRRAVFTLVDEILLACPRQTEPARLSGWFSHCLQITYFGDTSGGERFYRQLSALLVKTAAQETTRAENPLTLGASSPFASLALNLQPGAQRNAAGAFPMPQNLPNRTEHIIAPDHIASCFDALQPDCGQGEAGRSALAAICLHALCLLYGFKGALYGPHKATVVRELMEAASRLLARLNLPALTIPPDVPKTGPQPQTSKHSLFRRPALFILVPLLLCGVWYLFCSDMVNTITIP